MSLDVERLAIYLNATIVYITKFNTLGCVECGSDVDDEQEWEEASLDGVGSIAIHNNSRIASLSRDSKTLIFYQTPAGSIGSIMYDSGEKKWAHRETTEAAPAAAPGTPVFALRLTDAFGLFYLSDDRNICGLLQKYDNSGCQKWKLTLAPELAFNNSLFEGEVDNFIILPNDQADGFEAYVRAANDLVHITSTGERSNLGKWAAVGFIPDSDAERGKRIRPGLYTLGGHASSKSHYASDKICIQTLSLSYETL
ncbi:uncharacterized protein TRIVIDRAFT_66215 [Trichoderma virens Gv29-8]|uniref:Fucose-specific lectin n=1 Tax=Hypocrea virens (strain Gv29-8 / FGSC 10586) TaxID=413071 RepID=G9N8G4_HYPVG|nr:uncharacterized protein TRIVIDRAFT_66215 [Trichoderma virens Gv29-8]EHK17272.1 hypothetical protein TRIVIDRAFT_66215 [Trichoderma virens Gv29-8]UKZ55688.1 hypothetical protein TrVGV298_009512 [Trichoderma virens]